MGVKSMLAKVPTPTCWFGTEQVIFFATSFVVLSTNKLGKFLGIFFFLFWGIFFSCVN
jgi:predicted transporter